MCPQEADGQPHDGGLVQVGAHAVRQGQLVGQLVEDLRLLASPASGSIPGLLLPPLRATPRAREVGEAPKHHCHSITALIDTPRTPNPGRLPPNSYTEP